MIIGRFGLAILALAVAGYFVEQRQRAGSRPTDTPTFALMITGVRSLLEHSIIYQP